MEAQLIPGERRTAHQMVRDSLRRAILDGTLPAGSRLVQADIAARLRVSTTPVREALRDLASEGLIRLDAHRGAVVRETSLAEVREIYLIRRLLEPEAVKVAVQELTPDLLARLERLQAELDAAREPGRWVALNREFHRVLNSAAGLHRLAEILNHLDDNAAVYVNMALRAADADHLDSGNEHHQRLLEACRDGDGERAAKLVVEHLQQTLSTVERAVTSLR
ncbi:DNA-binding transcriptional regulator, GntR family [Asanoa hainanensis]|uniref:DNA-binding transcriptional regulator, GntR family n=1 Tax=Asanoa hainanensis TaxID=560556 RepID=A0A239K621_9ACTN|nr:GntR family transcriptional regulator [Asanoa hainanensis]SNT13083.1 DNA-binding transcriptional regulator, GntR family [Asanoa hainanensis]